MNTTQTPALWVRTPLNGYPRVYVARLEAVWVLADRVRWCEARPTNGS